MDMDEFGQDPEEIQQPGQHDHVGSTPPVKKPRGRGGGGSEIKVCPAPGCFDSQKKGSRLCLRHQRLLDVMRYQAKHAGEEQLKSFSEKMSDTETMVEEVMKFASLNADVPEAKTKKQVNWTDFNRRHGISQERSQTARTAPFEREQWILRQVNKFGRKREFAAAQWEQFGSSGVARADYLGFNGQVRLWLPKGEFEDSTLRKFIEGSMNQTIDRKKNLKDSGVDALRNHVHDMFNQHGVSPNDDFFKGATLQKAPSSCNKRDRDDEAEGNGRGSSEDEAPAIDRSKRARASTSAVVMVDLEDQEDDTEQARKKATAGKKKKRVNVQELQASVYTKMTEGLAVKKKDIEARLEDATKQLAAEKASPETAPGDKTEKITRQLKVSAIQQLRCLALVWLNKPNDELANLEPAGGKSKDGVKLEPNEEELEKGAGRESAPAASESNPQVVADGASTPKADEAAQETKEAELGVPSALTQALSQASRVHSIGFPHHVRCFDWMEEYAEKIVEMQTEEEVERARLVWRRLEVTLTSFNSAIKSANGSLKKFLDKREADRVKAEAKKKEAADKERIGKQKADLTARAKTLATTAAPVPKIFTIDRPMFKPMHVLTHASAFDSSKACVLAAGGLLKHPLEEYLTKPTIQQVMTGVGGRYKKMEGYQQDGKATATLTVRQGKEETEQLFTKVGQILGLKPMSLVKISSAWNTTSWLWGVRPTTFWMVCQTPNAAGYFKLVLLGELEVWVLDTKSAIDAADKMSVKCKGLDELTKFIQDMDAEQFRKFEACGAVVSYQKMKKEDMLWAPVGSLVMEKASDASLIYGVRKSFLFDTAGNKHSFEQMAILMKESGQSVSKMEQVLGLFRN